MLNEKINKHEAQTNYTTGERFSLGVRTTDSSLPSYDLTSGRGESREDLKRDFFFFFCQIVWTRFESADNVFLRLLLNITLLI